MLRKVIAMAGKAGVRLDTSVNLFQVGALVTLLAGMFYGMQHTTKVLDNHLISNGHTPMLESAAEQAAQIQGLIDITSRQQKMLDTLIVRAMDKKSRFDLTPLNPLSVSPG